MELGGHPIKTYHFSCGNSTKGPIGFCAEVVADTQEKAVSRLRRALVDALGPLEMVRIRLEQPWIGYVNVYINPDYIGVSEIEFHQPINNRR